MTAVEKINKAMDAFDDLSMEMDLINSLSYLLWDSITNGVDCTDALAHGNGAYLLNVKVDEARKTFNEAFELMLEGRRELKHERNNEH